MSDPKNAASTSTSDSLGWAARLTLKVAQRLRVGQLSLTLPNGDGHFEITGDIDGPSAALQLHSYRLAGKLIRSGDVGFAESYMAGEWDTPDLAALLYLLHLNEFYLLPNTPRLRRLAEWYRRCQHLFIRRNNRSGSRRNISYHYDLGNDFYRLWLDETWAYSSAVFQHERQPLADAQRHKFDLLIDMLELDETHHLLEIGCGWGGFAIHAAQRSGCRVTGITLSTEQLNAARQRAEAAGVSDRVEFRLQDYRDVPEQFDRVVSIEMYEAVGESYWPVYFRKIHDSLKASGRAVIQAITIQHGQFDYYRNNVDFIQKYIFPGGMLASPEVFRQVAARAGLVTETAEFYGEHYAETLRRWHVRVQAARSDIVQQFDERFLRMWRYYLDYCRAGFTSGHIDMMQIALSKGEA